MAEQTKTDVKAFIEYTELLASLEEQKQKDYAEAGTLPPGVVSRNPDTTTPEANYASRDNIVVSGASPANVQAAVESLGSDEARRDALDAADVAQGVSREDYEAAVLSAAPTGDPDAHPGEVHDVDEEPEDGPKATGGTQPDEAQVDAVLGGDAAAESQGEPFAQPEGAQPEHVQESGPDAVESDGQSVGPADPAVADPNTQRQE